MRGRKVLQSMREEKCRSEGFLGSRVVFGPRVGWDWQIASDLRKQLTIPQETLSTGLRVVVVRSSVNCLFGKADSAMWWCGWCGLKGKYLVSISSEVGSLCSRIEKIESVTWKMDTEYILVVQMNRHVICVGSHVCINSAREEVNLTWEMQTWPKNYLLLLAPVSFNHVIFLVGAASSIVLNVACCPAWFSHPESLLYMACP